MIIYTLDSETDPFLKGRKPEPFAWGLYNGSGFRSTWGEHCTRDIVNILWNQEPGIVYLHNGGKFDIFYLLEYIDMEKDMLIIKDRIVQCYLKCATGFHKLRDSLKILPFSLDTYKKDHIDYSWFEADVRESHREEILHYLRGDCVYLHELCCEYIKQFGPAITIGTTAMKELKKFHDIGETLNQDEDNAIRHKYFFGARVERYVVGVHRGDWKCYDVNSMYPHVMSSFYHPVGHPSSIGTTLNKDTYFITFRGYSDGAFPKRTKNGGVIFPKEHGIYNATIHEWEAAHELGLVQVDEILECVNFQQSRCFVDYITHYYGARKKARLDGDHMHELFYKFLLNNSYGKFAINPENFQEYRLTSNTYDMRWTGYSIAEIIESHNLILWSRDTKEFKYANIATGASITGASRAVLMRGLSGAVEPMYCDTDSIICRELTNVVIDKSQLGAWKLEKTGKLLAIAGRKMYALWQESERFKTLDGCGILECVKYASKGVRITPQEITAVARGEVITYQREAPTYRLNGSVDWITRRVRMV